MATTTPASPSTKEVDGRENNNNNASKQYPHWHDFVAGAVAGAGARVLTHPLDLIRIRRQLAHFQSPPPTAAAATTAADAATAGQQENPHLLRAIANVIRNEGGIPALFRGNLPAMGLWVSYTAVQFSSYGTSRDYFATLLPGESNRGVVAFLAGATAGVAATVSTYPLDLCRTIFAARGTNGEQEATSTTKVSKVWSTWAAGSESSASSTSASTGTPNKPQPPRPPRSVLEFATNLNHRQGLRGFFAGSLPTVIQIVPYMGCSFYIYDMLTHDERNVGLSAYAGSIAGAVSKAIVYPMDTVKKRMQAQAFFGAHDVHRGRLQLRYYTGMVDCLMTIYQTEGLASFYRGLWPSVLKTSLAAGISFAMFRTTKNALETFHDGGEMFVPMRVPAATGSGGVAAGRVHSQEAEGQFNDDDCGRDRQRGGRQRQNRADETRDDINRQQQVVEGGLHKGVRTEPALTRNVSGSSPPGGEEDPGRPKAVGSAVWGQQQHGGHHEHQHRERQQDYRSLLKRRPTTHFD